MDAELFQPACPRDRMVFANQVQIKAACPKALCCRLAPLILSHDRRARARASVACAPYLGKDNLSAIWPDSRAPIIRRHPDAGGCLTRARWGMPTPPAYLEGKRTDPGVTNIRNPASPHWRRWLEVEHRCLGPFTSFSELDARQGMSRNHPVWFALGQGRPLAFCAGIRTEWISLRKLKEGEVATELFGFLTCAPNHEVRPIHPEAMPVVLTRSEEWRIWLTTPAQQAMRLQRPLPDGALEIVLEEGA